MPIIDMKDMLKHACRNGYAVGSFDISSMEVLQAVMGAAEQHRAPVILEIPDGEGCELIMEAAEAAARRASVPAALHYRWGYGIDTVLRAARIGCNGFTADGSNLSLGEHIELTKQACDEASACGLACGGVLGGEGLTHVAEARGFAEKTGIDFLEVSFSSRNSGGKAKPDWTRLREICEAVGIPLAVEAGCELSDDQYRKIAALGVSKVTCKISLEDLAQKLIRGKPTLNALLSGLAQAAAEAVGRYMLLLGSAGRAAEILAQSRPWLNVEHVVAFNAPFCSETELRFAMKEGQRILGGIPGVRAVVAGSVTERSARYRHCWLVRLASPAALENFRKHPDQLAFEEKLLRPATADRIVGDYTIADQETGAEQLPLSIPHPADIESGHPEKRMQNAWRVHHG
jgi:fructose-bisphosphate aldolase class II